MEMLDGRANENCLLITIDHISHKAKVFTDVNKVLQSISITLTLVNADMAKK